MVGSCTALVLHARGWKFGGGGGACERLSGREERLCIVGIFGTCEGQEKCVRSFRWRKLNEEGCLHDVGVDGRVTFECILKK
jgi:hypothetical protein